MQTNTTSQPLVTSPSSPPAAWPLPKAMIALICLITPVLGGSILYYAWREKCPDAARYANQMSFTMFGLVFVLSVAYSAVQGHLQPHGKSTAPAVHATAR